MRCRPFQNDSAVNKAQGHQRRGLSLAGVSALLAVVGLTFPRTVCAKPATQYLVVTVRVYNYAQTPSSVLAEAEREASRILGEAGLKSVWLDCPVGPSTNIPENPCAEPIDAADIRLRILSVPAPNSLHDTAYGFVIPPALATVYSESALRFARNEEGEFEGSIVLGCAIAHEIGHLLLGSNSHSISGVMCAHWERKHIRQALMGAMLFTPKAARIMQAEMRRRMASEIAGPTTEPLDSAP